MSTKSSPKLACAILCLCLTGCAIVRPHLDTRLETPIDWGLECGHKAALTVQPFVTTTEAERPWGVYAAQHMQEYLLADKAFQRILLSDKESVATRYVLTGEINQMFYGGTFTPTKVSVTIRVIDRQDGQTRFLRKAYAEAEKRGLDLELLTRLYVSSPYPEELLNGLLKTAAKDIAGRTNASAHCQPDQE